MDTKGELTYEFVSSNDIRIEHLQVNILSLKLIAREPHVLEDKELIPHVIKAVPCDVCLLTLPRDGDHDVWITELIRVLPILFPSYA